MSTDAVLVDNSAGCWTVHLNRPGQGNALSPEMVAALSAVLDKAVEARARSFVVEGQGRHFCTGFDLSSLSAETDDSLLARFVRVELLLQQIARAPFRTFARAHGRTVGAGADLFAACDVRLADADTTFAFPGSRGFGLVLGTRRLALRVGERAALDWVRSARTIKAEEALHRGLATAQWNRDAPIDAPAENEVQPVSPELLSAITPEGADEIDLALLVRSAARPGLKDRVAAYAAGVASARAKTHDINLRGNTVST